MITIHNNGDIRWDGPDETYTVLEFHRGLMEWAEMLEQIHLPVPSTRITDEYIELNPPYNIDEEVARHITDGTLYDVANNIIWQSRIDLGDVTI